MIVFDIYMYFIIWPDMTVLFSINIIIFPPNVVIIYLR